MCIPRRDLYIDMDMDGDVRMGTCTVRASRAWDISVVAEMHDLRELPPCSSVSKGRRSGSGTGTDVCEMRF